LDDPKLDLAVTLRDFRLSNSDQLRAVASGQVRLAGTLAAPEVTGQLRLGRTDVFTGAEAARAQVEEVILTPADRRMLAREFGPAAIQEARHSPGLVERTRLDVGLELPGRVWIRRRETPAMDIELSGRMRLRQDPGGQMQFFGQVEPVANRSTLEVSGREFLLTSGTIRLNGPVEQAHLDVNAEYQVPVAGSPDQEPVVVQVNAVGRPDSLALTFTSDPTMSQEDILSYIVTGRPAADNPLTAQQASGGNLGKQIALGQLSQAISSRAGEGLGFDVFQIRQEGTRGLTLTAGRYLGSKLFVDLQLPLQILGTASQLPGVGLGPGFEADYAFYRWLRAGLSGGSLPTGFRLRGRHAY
jgi:autotransporter translocation and assembly factor TamB